MLVITTTKGKGPSTSALSSSSSTTSSSSPSPSESSDHASTRVQSQCRQLLGLDEMLLNRGDRSYKSFGNENWTRARDFKANAAFRSHNNSMMRSERSKTQWHRGGFGDADIPPELANSIFGGVVSTEVRGKRFALLTMDESGRWRVAHSQRPAKTFPGNEK